MNTVEPPKLTHLYEVVYLVFIEAKVFLSIPCKLTHPFPTILNNSILFLFFLNLDLPFRVNSSETNYD